MSNYKNGRMPKNKYVSLVENGCIKEKSCHKKQSTNISRFHHGLKYSRDIEGNVLCAGCKMLLIPKNVSNDVFSQYVSKIYKTGGCHNCCYDCEFSSFCNKCALNWVSKSGGSYVATCPYSFLEQIKNNSYGGGKYSRLDEEQHKCLKEVFSSDIKYNNSLCGMFVDPGFLMELYKENNYKKNFCLYKNTVKELLSKLPVYDPSLEQEDYSEFYITIDKVRKKFFEHCNDNKTVSVKKVEDIKTRPEMKGPVAPSFASLFDTINAIKKLYV